LRSSDRRTPNVAFGHLSPPRQRAHQFSLHLHTRPRIAIACERCTLMRVQPDGRNPEPDGCLPSNTPSHVSHHQFHLVPMSAEACGRHHLLRRTTYTQFAIESGLVGAAIATTLRRVHLCYDVLFTVLSYYTPSSTSSSTPSIIVESALVKITSVLLKSNTEQPRAQPGTSVMMISWVTPR